LILKLSTTSMLQANHNLPFPSSKKSVKDALKLSWTLITPSPDQNHGTPLPRSSHGVSTIPSTTSSQDHGTTRVYIYGGENVARTPLDDSQCTWCATQIESASENSEIGHVVWKWSLIDTPVMMVKPSKRIGHAQCTIGSSIYIFGGRCGISMGESCLQDMWELNCSIPGKEEWKKVIYNTNKGCASSTPPEPRSYHKMISDRKGENLYVFGGCGADGRLADLHKFNLGTKMWENLGLSNLLAGRGGANFFILDRGTKLAVISGFIGEETRDGHVFDLSVGKWDEKVLEGLDSMRPRSVCASNTISLGEKKDEVVGLIFGGEVDPSGKGHEGAGSFENDVVLIDGTSGAIKQIIKSSGEDKWPPPRGWADGSAGKSGEFYVFGGLAGDDDNPKRLGDLWVCNLEQ